MEQPGTDVTEQLYLLACTFSPEIDAQVRALQQEICTRFGPSRSLSKPVHLTLMPPFWAPAVFETWSDLDWLATQIPTFELELEGIGCFANPKSPVLYVHVNPQPQLARLYKALRKLWTVANYPVVRWPAGFHPHVTIAYRDVKPDVFRELWPAFRYRPFHAAFVQDSFTLFRWENHRWVPIREFRLMGK
jgi:2'-5' RNA ligase